MITPACRNVAVIVAGSQPNRGKFHTQFAFLPLRQARNVWTETNTNRIPAHGKNCHGYSDFLY